MSSTKRSLGSPDTSNGANTPPKKAKVTADELPTARLDSNGDRYWEISRLRRVTVSSFRGKTLVNVREYYEKDGQELPGKKVSSEAGRLSPVEILRIANYDGTAEEKKSLKAG